MKTQDINIVQKIKCGKKAPITKVWQTNKMLSYMARKHSDITEVCDALEPMQITLTPKNISEGVPKNHTKCAFANAACATLGVESAFLGRGMGCFKSGKTLVRFCLPESVSHQLRMFDYTGKCEPATTYRFSGVPLHRQIGRPQQPPRKNGKKQPNRKHGGGELDKNYLASLRKAIPKD